MKHNLTTYAKSITARSNVSILRSFVVAKLQQPGIFGSSNFMHGSDTLHIGSSKIYYFSTTVLAFDSTVSLCISISKRNINYMHTFYKVMHIAMKYLDRPHII